MKNIIASLLFLGCFTTYAQQGTTGAPANGQVKIETNPASNPNQVQGKKLEPAAIDREKIIIREGKKKKETRQGNN